MTRGVGSKSLLRWRLYHVVKAEAPKVDKFTELGDLRYVRFYTNLPFS